LKKRLYKSKKEKMIDGVCGGLAEYIDIDPTIIRLLWVLLVFCAGTGVLAYIVAMIIIPREP
jgi:phage shock protein C